MNLIIEIGNTRSKLYVFNSGKIVFKKSVTIISVKEIKAILKNFKITFSLLSAVAGFSQSLKKLLHNKSRCIYFSDKISIPVKNKYKSPKTLGRDRLANAIGAAKHFPGKNSLIIDAGTCLKFDFVDAKKNYIGGAISPGLSMRFKSLHDYTAKLPLIKSAAKKIKLVGRTTEESILSGIQNGMIAEIEQTITSYKNQFGQINVIITGGDSALFAHALKTPIFAAPDLTAIGLNEIIEHNKNRS